MSGVENSRFDLLSLIVNFTGPKPAVFEAESINGFYIDPNGLLERELAFLGDHSRILLHEAFHYWQCLGSGYLANLLQSEWLRLREFERTGTIQQPHDLVKGFALKSGEALFSAHQLMECGARFWDVHSRSPLVVIKEEKGHDRVNTDLRNLFLEELGKFEKDPLAGYNLWWVAVAMNLDRSRYYTAPYIWGRVTLFNALTDLPEDELLFAHHDQYAAAYELLFPALVYVSLLCISPGPIFQLLVNTFCTNKNFIEHIGISDGTFDDAVASKFEVTVDNLCEFLRHHFPKLNAIHGYAVFERMEGDIHPVACLARNDMLRASDTLANFAAMKGFQCEMHSTGQPASHWAEDNRFAPLMYMGLPQMRALLGTFLPPPAISFDDAFLLGQPFTCPPDELQIRRATLEDLNTRVRSFRLAEKALELGLPLDAFRN